MLVRRHNQADTASYIPRIGTVQMHQILESYVRDFREKVDLERVRDSTAFEHFASHCVFRNYPRPPDDYDFEDITCGDATGIDAIATFINERFVESVEALES